MIPEADDLFGWTPPPAPPTYPDVPGHVNVDTSIAAAQSMQDLVAGLRGRILDWIRSRDITGATCDEVELNMHLSHQTASARIRELVLGGLLRDSELRRKTRSGRGARVYCVT